MRVEHGYWVCQDNNKNNCAISFIMLPQIYYSKYRYQKKYTNLKM